MPKYKIRVNSKQAVESIRSGMSDLALMDEYALSARGLQSLFRKLTAAGEIEQSELNARHLACQQSHIVDLIISQPKYEKKAVIDADQAVQDIRGGMSDIELMQKYDVSAQGLESLFSKLIAASQISPLELDERKHRFRWSEMGFEKNSAENGEPYAANFRWSTRSFLRDHRVFSAALVGACIGMVLMFLAVGVDRWVHERNDSKKNSASLKAANEALYAQAQEMIGALELISRREYPPGSTTGNSNRGEYEKCMKNCEGAYRNEDALEKAFIINCKKECLSLHSERFRKIRELYH